MIDEAGSRLCIQAFTITCFADFHRSGDVDQQKISNLRDLLPDPLPGFRVRSDRRANGDAAMPSYLRRHIANPGDVEITIGAAEGQASREERPHQVTIEQGYPATAVFGQQVTQIPGDR